MYDFHTLSLFIVVYTPLLLLLPLENESSGTIFSQNYIDAREISFTAHAIQA